MYGHRAGRDEPVELVSIQLLGIGLRSGNGVPERITLQQTSKPAEGVRRAYFGAEFGWLDAEIIHGDSGEPIVRLNQKAKRLLESKGGSRALVSLTHLESVASSIVVLINE